MFAALLTTILFALSAVTGTKLTHIFASPALANLTRLIVAVTILGLWAHNFGVGALGPTFPLFFVSGVIGFGLGDVALFKAFRRVGSRVTVMIVHCVAAPLAAAAEWGWLGIGLSLGQIAAAALTLFGVALALSPQPKTPVAKQGRIAGILWALVAAFGQGMGAVVSRVAYDAADRGGFEVDPMTAAYHRLLGGILFSILWVGLVSKDRVRLRGLSGAKIRGPALWVLANAASGPAFGVACFQWALATTPTGIVLPIVALTPIVLMPMTYRMEKDRPERIAILGAVIAVAGVILLNQV